MQRTLIRPPSSRLGPLTDKERQAVMAKSLVKGSYDDIEDRESAFEILAKRTKKTAATPEEARAQAEEEEGGGIGDFVGTIFGTNRKRGQVLTTGQKVAREVTRVVVGRTAGNVAAEFGKSVGGKFGGSVGRAIVRGVLGGILRR